jgi:iron complex transport system substrate-binding protein
VISQVPSITETLYALGLEDRIVAVSRYCRFPPRAQEKPTIGGFHDASYESIIAASPDWVAIFPGQGELIRFLESLNCRVYAPTLETFADVFAIFDELGKVFDVEERAAELVKSVSDEIQDLSREFQGLPRKRVLYVVGREPGSLKGLYVVGDNNFMNEMLESAGAENVGAIAEGGRYPVLSLETLLRLDPEIILDGGAGEEPATQDATPSEWTALSSLAAVRAEKVIPVHDPHLTIPGPSIPENIRKLANLLHGSSQRP